MILKSQMDHHLWHCSGQKILTKQYLRSTNLAEFIKLIKTGLLLLSLMTFIAHTSLGGVYLGLGFFQYPICGSPASRWPFITLLFYQLMTTSWWPLIVVFTSINAIYIRGWKRSAAPWRRIFVLVETPKRLVTSSLSQQYNTRPNLA